MTQVVIFGKKLKSDGTLHEDFIQRLEGAIELSTRVDISRIIISGGCARKDGLSEARVGENYLRNRKISLPMELDEKAMTTMQNLAYTDKILLEAQEKIFIVISASSKERVGCFCKWYFPNLYKKTTFIVVKGNFSARDFLLNLPFWFLR